ncbi:hypothetical protein EYR40_002025 [Pleurotus pulmonarius]|nr:hypothetical protein EYR36_011576 [Pleurotus pulmonarius]KAF4585188.1 hypothetical protein EYR40_002025 [Pleurotus pulmonarius]
MSHPDVRLLMCAPSYDSNSDFSYPYKRHSVHSIQSLPSSAMDDPRELSSFYGRPASHISPPHYSMGSGHEGDNYTNAQYTPRAPEPPQHSLYAHTFYDYDLRQPHHQTGWGGVDPHTIASDSPMTYGTLGGSSFPEAPRLTPPPAPAITNGQRLTLAGSLDPTTGIFYRTPEHPRLRTAQACEKCRTRKAKCSGEHPACQRCITRGLVCEYAKEGRVRGPNRVKSKSSVSSVSDSRRASLAIEDSGRKSEPSNGASSAPPSSPGKNALQQSPPPSVPTTTERAKFSRPRPPHLRLDTESNHFQREERLAAEQAPLVQAEVLHRERSDSQPFVVFDEHGNHAPVYWTQEHGAEHEIAVGGSHMQTNNPPCDGEVEAGQMNYLLQQPFHPAMLELHHPVATIPAQLNMEPSQYQHTQNSISSLTYSATSASSVSSPVTPSSATYTERDTGGHMGSSAEFQFFLSYSDVERPQQQGFESTWSDPDQMHSTPTVDASHKLSLAVEGTWSEGIDYPMEPYHQERHEIDPVENMANQPLHYPQQ